MNEKQATAILMGNLKGAKNKPTNLLQVSEACTFLLKKWGIKEVSRYFSISEYMLRQIEKIILLDSDTKKYVRQNELGIEKAYQLWRIDPSKRKELLPMIKNLSTSDIRNLIYVMKNDPTKSVKKAKELFDEKYAKKTTMMVLAIPTDLINRLNKISKKEKTSPTQYVMKLIEVACHK